MTPGRGPSGPGVYDGRTVQEMVIYGVSFDMVGKQPIVLLKTVDSNKFLPIWIGHPEAAAILAKLQGATTPRPMTHDLIVDVLGELEVKCSQVAVTELRDNTFFASITLSGERRELEIDSRPSDALALAVRSGAPIFAAEEVIAESAIEFEHEVEDTEEVVDRFKEFLDQVSPEDFMGESGEERSAARAAPASIRSTRRSKPMPAASAACGRRLVSVMPGMALASRTCRSPVAPSSMRSTRAAPAQPKLVDLAASSWARMVISSGSPAGQVSACRRPRSARRTGPRPRQDRLDHGQRLAVQDRHRQVAPGDPPLEQDLARVGERRHEGGGAAPPRPRRPGARAPTLDRPA